MITDYSKYTSDEQITVSHRNLFTDNDGFPNENAFRDFATRLTEKDGYYLACVSIDVAPANASKGYAYGTLIMRKIYAQLKEYFYIFRVNGDKFNLVLQKKDFDKARRMLSSKNKELFQIYFGIVDNTPMTNSNINDIRRRGIDLMYLHKSEITQKNVAEVRDDRIVGDKGNTPPELQETTTHKFIETMWYGKIRLEETEPSVRIIDVYVYPTEYNSNMSVNLIAVTDDLVDYRIYTGNKITFSFDRIKFTISARFDNDGHLSIVCFKDRFSEGSVDIKIESHEGVCIPASFGKRIGNGKEIYPIKANTMGTCDYVLWDSNKHLADICTTGIVEINSQDYAVITNSKGIDLIKQ